MAGVRNDTGEDNDRDTVTDTTFSDLFAEPHQEHSPCDQTDNSGEIECKAGLITGLAYRAYSADR